MKTLYLCGAGNAEGIRLALGINRARRRWDEIVVLDDDPASLGRRIVGVEVVAPFSMLADASASTAEVVNNVARTTARRRAAQKKIAGYGLPFVQLVHPSVELAGTTLGADCLIFQNATIGAMASVAEQTVVFMGAAVGHGSRVGRGCIVAPNAVINARVELADEVYVGTNASIIPDATIGSGATIGANTAVMTDVPPGATVLGVPGKVLMIPRADHGSETPPVGPSRAKAGASATS